MLRAALRPLPLLVSSVVALSGCGLSAEELMQALRGVGQHQAPIGEPRLGSGCYASTDCSEGERCSTERGECLPPPGCEEGEACPAVCYGTCEAASEEGEACGSVRCAEGTVCCNPSCGICVPPDGACTLEACE